MKPFYVKTTIVLGDKEWSLGYDLSENGIGEKPLTRKKYEHCLACLVPQAIKFLRDNGKITEL